MDNHLIQWCAPSPLWVELTGAGNPAGRATFGAPTILRFASDDFMQDFFNVLATDPRRLGEFRAVPETWRGKSPPPTVPTPRKVFALHMQRLGNQLKRGSDVGSKRAISKDATALATLKLYQPAHMRYYLITACLTCQATGLPDRKVDTGKQEKASFVMRRLFPPGSGGTNPANWEEHAWVKTGAGYAWQKVVVDPVGRAKSVVAEEERLPVFPASFAEDDERKRRLFAGLIPVGRREAYLGGQRRDSADSTSGPNATTSKTARKILFRKLVSEPWKQVVLQAKNASTAISEDPTNHETPEAAQVTAILQSAREQIQTGSWLILLDLAQFLSEQAPTLWKAICGSVPRSDLKDLEKAAYDLCDQTTLAGDIKAVVTTADYPSPVSTLKEALAGYAKGDAIDQGLKNKIESAQIPFVQNSKASRDAWPAFLFPLADPTFLHKSLLAPAGAVAPVAPDEETKRNALVAEISKKIDDFTGAIVAALPEKAVGPDPEIPTAAELPAAQNHAFFRIRCVYERPACGPLHDDVVSEPTEPFELAGFFDPDAPARPIRIGLPIDTTPAGLRKFDKNTAFIMSDVLCGQVQKLRGLTLGDLIRSVLPWPLHKDLSVGDMGPCASGGTPIGMVCSLSIPIITICALILLMIIVTLLDFVFRWLPFFMICFPLPGFKAKSNS
jgi:hypothetical protein